MRQNGWNRRKETENVQYDIEIGRISVEFTSIVKFKYEEIT